MHITETKNLSRDYLLLLGHAWENNKSFFSTKGEYDYFRQNIYSFCNSVSDSNLSGGDFQTIYSFVESSIVNILDNSLEDTNLSAVSTDLSYLNIFIEFLSQRFNQKLTTQLFLKKIATTLLRYPVNNDNAASVELIMGLYDSSDILYTVCHYMTILNLTDIPEEVLANFMKKARVTKQSRLFRFYLYPFNEHFFRCNYPAYPDECDARELYFGIYYGYFTLTYNSEVYKTLIKMCESVEDNLICKKSHFNPVYNYYLLSEHNSHLSITDIYVPLKRLFRD